MPKRPKSSPRKKRAKLRQNKRNKAKTASKSQLNPNKVLQPLPGTAAFIKLQAQWYAKAAESGFQDLEHVNRDTGEGLHMLKGKSLSSFKLQDTHATLHYYRRWSCFLAHNPKHSNSHRELDIAKMWADGATYPELVRTLKPIYKKGLSMYTIQKYLQYMDKRIERWNKLDPRGLDFTPHLGVL